MTILKSEESQQHTELEAMAKTAGKEETAVPASKLDALLNAPLKRTGNDIAEGSYPGILYGFGEPFEVKTAERFRKPGQPDMRTVMELQFGIKTKDGVQSVEYLVPVPEDGAANRKSNLYKALKALRGSDLTFFTKDGNFAEGVSLAKFIGSHATISVRHNDKEFPTVEAVAAAMEGVVGPTMEDCKSLASSGSDGIPF